MAPERPDWQERVHELTLPEWGTTKPLSLDKAIELRVYDSHKRPAVERSMPDSKPDPLTGAANQFRRVHRKDYRDGGLANDSAFEATATEFDPTIQLLGALRSKIHPYDKPIDLRQLGEVVSAAVMFPNWLVLKSDNPMRNGEVPPEIAGVVRVGRGLEKMLNDIGAYERMKRYPDFSKEIKGDGGVNPASLIETVFDGQHLHTYSTDPAADNHILPQKDKFVVCPASRGMIEQSMHALFEQPQGSEDILERTGMELSENDISRIKKLGKARQANLMESIILDIIRNNLTSVFTAHAQALTSAVDLGIRIDQSRFVNMRNRLYDRADESVKKLNSAQHLADQALGRDRGRHHVKLEDFDIPRI